MTEEIIRQFSIAARYGKQEEGGHLPRVRAAKAARACVVFDRLGPFGFVLYFLIIVGAIVALVHVTSRVADYAIASRAREASAATRTSGGVGLEAQQRAAGWQPSGSVPERPTEPDVSATELAKGIDDAENHPLPSSGIGNRRSELVSRISRSKSHRPLSRLQCFDVRRLGNGQNRSCKNQSSGIKPQLSSLLHRSVATVADY